MQVRWFTRFPDEPGQVKESTMSGSFFYELRGRSGRWFVVRIGILDGKSERTKYYKNMAQAGEVFEHLTAS